MIISIDAKKACDKIQDPFMIRELNKIEDDFLNMTRIIYEKLKPTIILIDERPKVFSLRSEERKNACSHHFNMVMEVRSEQLRKTNKTPKLERKGKVSLLSFYIENPKE